MQNQLTDQEQAIADKVELRILRMAVRMMAAELSGCIISPMPEDVKRCGAHLAREADGAAAAGNEAAMNFRASSARLNAVLGVDHA